MRTAKRSSSGPWRPASNESWCPAGTLPRRRQRSRLAERHAPLVQGAVGLHPHYAAAADEGTWRELEGLLGDPRCAAAGEIGLDFFRNLSPPDVQRAAFERQLGMAAERDLPVLVHDRDAHDEVTAALSRWPGRRASGAARGVLHAFSGDAAMAATLTGRGFLVSFALPVSFRSAVGPRSAAAAIPAESYLAGDRCALPRAGPPRPQRADHHAPRRGRARPPSRDGAAGGGR